MLNVCLCVLSEGVAIQKVVKRKKKNRKTSEDMTAVVCGNQETGSISVDVCITTLGRSVRVDQMSLIPATWK